MFSVPLHFFFFFFGPFVFYHTMMLRPYTQTSAASTLLLLDLQLLVLVEPEAHDTHFLGPQIQGLAFLALEEFPEAG